MLGLWLILFLLMVFSMIAAVLFFIIAAFLIIFSGVFAGAVSGALSNNGLKGVKVFLFVACIMTGIIFGGLSYLVVFSIMIGNTPESLLQLIYFVLPGSIAGSLIGFAAAFLLNLGLIKFIGFASRTSDKIKTAWKNKKNKHPRLT
ncbi:MAG: hypothetical protein KA015_01635 [Spirochaetes bacterium]|nr:hypothetical protein [Spirochaetota bacterium]